MGKISVYIKKVLEADEDKIAMIKAPNKEQVKKIRIIIFIDNQLKG